MHTPTVLIVEDQERMRRILELMLRPEGYDLLLASTGEDGVQMVRTHPGVDLVLTDLQLGGKSGLDVLEVAKQVLPEVPVLLLTGHGTVKSAVEAMRKGAYDYLQKPVDNEELKLVIARALKLRRLSQDNRALRARLDEKFGFDRIISVSAKMREVKRVAQDVARTDASVLVTGESGTGKELLARAIHYSSARAHGPLVALNCAGIPEPLLESELFGYEPGAFTDAKKAKRGRFQMADHGTLFLDEISEMSLAAQAKLLRVLEDRTVEPLGTERGVKVDIRVICATNKPMADLLKPDQFREDLYYRLNVCPLHIPPLRERQEDIAALLEAFVSQAMVERGTRIRRISPDALAILEGYRWPGNVRELHNVVEWVTITCDAEEIRPGHLPAHLRTAEQGTDPKRPSLLSFGLSIEELEKAMLQEALEKANGNVAEASRLLKITRNTLRYRMAKYHLHG